MSPPEIWGPPIWTLFHTLAEKVNEKDFMNIKNDLFYFIKKICNFLPCPECSQHAKLFLAKININNINNKEQFKQMIYFFHNIVNKRKKKPFFEYKYIHKYKLFNIGNVFNNFIAVYHTKGNMNLITESFQRSLVISEFKKWLVRNHKSFITATPKIPKNISTPKENLVDENNNSEKKM